VEFAENNVILFILLLIYICKSVPTPSAYTLSLPRNLV